ncbi:GSCOCG00005170001-RA-CDS, partial [Cotesia congregata]
MANRLFIYLLLIFFVFNVPILHSDAAHEPQICGRTKCSG